MNGGGTAGESTGESGGVTNDKALISFRAMRSPETLLVFASCECRQEAHAHRLTGFTL